MKKNNSIEIQKYRKKIIIILLVIIAIPIAIFLISNSQKIFSSMTLDSKESVKKEKTLPSELKWFNTFGEPK
ncbi:MAG: hypothetical protein ACERKK_10625 [Poseidonibacter sp.]|uniref:hypothetical protein n=1 Tax=Poseidonibacter sp. TaxID=2321188 RepID=UPI00359D97DE